MQIHLTFSFDGAISGDGIDDIGPFTIQGVFDCGTQGATWTKTYLLGHSVEYRGFYDGRAICGDWRIIFATGGFWIWPGERAASEGEVAEEEVGCLLDPLPLLRQSPSKGDICLRTPAQKHPTQLGPQPVLGRAREMSPFEGDKPRSSAAGGPEKICAQAN